MSRKALIVGPNIGVSMGKGGGVRVAATMGEVLAENGYRVSLCAFRGYPLNLLDKVHGTNLMHYRNQIQTHYLISAPSESSGTGSLAGALPIHVCVLPFSLYLRYVLRKVSPHLLVFHDDIPLLRRGDLRDRFLILYVHFSYATRLKLGVGDIAESVAPSMQSIEKLLNPLVKRLIFYCSNPANVIVANSSVTANFLKQTWNRGDVQVLYPPVDTEDFGALREKENLIVSVGVIQPNKRFEDVIRAMSMVRSECKLIIIGYYHQSWYYRGLQRLIVKTGIKDRAKIVPNASREQLKDALSRAKILVHASRFEPFGISVVEGMASGCVPIVHNGSTSGPWSDIVDRGEFGLGFMTIDELSHEIERVLGSETVYKHYSLRARTRSRQFDTTAFRRNLMRIMGRFAL